MIPLQCVDWPFMCVCMSVCVYACVLACVCVCVHMCVHVRVCVSVCVCPCVYACVYVRIRLCVHWCALLLVCSTADVDECNTVGLSNCSQYTHTMCENRHATYACVCLAGYSSASMTSSFENCADIDECAMGTHNCQPTETCMNSQGSFTCVGKCGVGNTRAYMGAVHHRCCAIVSAPSI